MLCVEVVVGVVAEVVVAVVVEVGVVAEVVVAFVVEVVVRVVVRVVTKVVVGVVVGTVVGVVVDGLICEQFKYVWNSLALHWKTRIDNWFQSNCDTNDSQIHWNKTYLSAKNDSIAVSVNDYNVR